MRRGILRKALALLLLHTLWPTLALAQSPKAGVVTTLHGVATVARLAAPPEIPLRFKDDVLFRDRITTREDSVVRVLLGGKALVTVRELSVLTISEEPDKATVELQAGKIALAVARQRLRPGEQIEIRTPNAIAAVRGTVVIVEVLRATAQVTPAAVAAVTTFYVLSGVLNVFVAGQQFTVGALQSLGIAGNVAGQIQPVTPAAAQQLKQDYTPPTQHGGSPSEAQQAVVSQQQAQLTALVAAVTGDAPQPTAPPPAADSTTAPASSTDAPTIATTGNPIPTPPPADVPDVQIAGTNVLVTGPLKSFSGTTSRTGTSPVVRITDSTVTQLGTDNLVQTAPGAAVSLNGSLLEGARSTITSGGSLLRLSSTLTAPGPLLDVTDTTLTVAGAVVKLSGGSTLTVTSDPAIRVSGGSLTADALGIGDGTGNTFHLTGTVLDLSNNATVSLRTLGESVPDNDTDTAIFNLGLNEPFIRMSNSALTLTGVGEELVGLGENDGPIPTQTGVALIATGSTINLKGSLLDLEAVTFTDPNALVQLNPTTVTQTATTDALVFIGPHGRTVTMAGPLFKASGSTLTTSGPVFDFQDGTLTSNTTQPFISLNPSTVTSSRNFALLSNSISLSLKGSFLDATDTVFSTTSDQFSFLAMADGASVTTSGTAAPLLKFKGTGPGLSKVTAARNFLPMAKTSSGSPTPSMTLSGPLLDAVKTDFKTGNPASTTGNTFTFLFVGDSSTLASTSASALLSFDASTVDTAGDVVVLRRSTSVAAPSKMTLSGPLFSATNGSSFNTTSLGFGAFFVTAASACCDGFFLGQGAQLTSTTLSPLIQLTNSTFNAGPDAQSGSTFFGIRDTFTGAPAAELVAPASVSLAGPLLKATDSTVMALFDLVAVARSSLTSSSPDALIQLGGNPGSTLQLGGTRTDPISPGTTAFGRLLFLQSSPASGTAASAASVSLAGPLLVSSNSTLTMTNDVVSVQNGATLSSTTSSALLQLANSSLTAGTALSNADVLEVFGTGGPGGTTLATVSLKGPLLTVASTLNVTGGLAGVFAGGKVTVTGSTDPFVKITGGNHSIASNSGMAMFRLFGSGTAVEVAEGVSLTLGTSKPLGHGGVLLETAGATISSQQGFQLDTALFEATKPLFNLLAGSASTVTSANDFINLSQKAKLVANLLPGDAMVKLNGSTLNVNNGSLFRVAGGSFLSVTGNLVALTGGSTLNILNGGLVALDGASVFKLTGSFGAFGTGTNTINLPIALEGFTVNTGIVPGFGVALKTGVASAGQVTVAGTFTPFTGAGAVTSNGIVLKVDDAGSKVKLCTTGCP